MTCFGAFCNFMPVCIVLLPLLLDFGLGSTKPSQQLQEVFQREFEKYHIEDKKFENCYYFGVTKLIVLLEK